MAFGLKWRCSECNHSTIVIYKGKLKRDLIEELEDGSITEKCCYCGKEKNLNESNSTIVKE